MKKHRKIIDLIISIVGAVMLWAYVINVVNPPQSVTLRDIPIKLLGLESIQATRLTIAGDGNYTCDVTVSAARSEITGITADDVAATVDLTGLSAGQNYANVKVVVPSNVTLEEVRSQKVQVYLDELVTEQRPLNIVYAGIEGDYEVTITSTETDSVLVTGAKSLVSMVTEVRADLDVNSLSVDSPTTGRLVCTPLDADGNEIKNVTLSHPKVYVTAVILPVRDVPLLIAYEGAPGLGAQLKEAQLPETLRVKAKTAVLKAISGIETEPINIAGITDDITVDVKYALPDNVYLAADAVQPVASFTLIHTGEISFTYGREEILVNNVPEDCLEYALEEQKVTVTAKGDLSIIRKLEAKDLQPFIDLSGIVEGSNDVEIQSGFTSGKVTVKIRPQTINVNAIMVPEEEPEETEGGDIPGEQAGEVPSEQPGSQSGAQTEPPTEPEGGSQAEPLPADPPEAPAPEVKN